jgi:hypothetical protein
VVSWLLFWLLQCRRWRSTGGGGLGFGVRLRGRKRRSEPQRCVCRFHRLVDHCQKLTGEVVQVELVAQPATEPGDDVDGIGPGRTHGRTVTGHTRCDRVVRLLHQASSAGLDRSRQQRADKSSA